MARGGKRIGSSTALSGKYALGDSAELSNRDKTGWQPEATHFTQIGPADSSANANEPNKGNSKSGNFKFTSAP